MFQAILSLLTTLPWLKQKVDEFIAWYVQIQIDSMKKDIQDGIRKAILDHDQRDLERAIGNSNAGEPSGIPGTSIVDDLPGVHHQG